MRIYYCLFCLTCLLVSLPGQAEEDLNVEKHLFYYHGKIVEDQGLAARNEKFGTYDYKLIIKALDAAGFTVHSEIRSAGTDVTKYAAGEVLKIQKLIDSGVRPRDISLVGGSKGAVIAITIQNTLKNKDIRSILLAGMFPSVVDAPTIKLYGHVLSIFDTSDNLLTKPDALIARSTELLQFKSVAVESGYGHGLLFKPYAEWIEPTIAWARGTTDEISKTAG